MKLYKKRPSISPPSGIDHAAEAHAFLNRQIAASQPLRPQQAANTNPLSDFYEPVERELRRAGFLR